MICCSQGKAHRSAGVKERAKLAAALRDRSTRIGTAVRAFNSAATRLGHATFEVKDVLAYASLGKFDLLRMSRHQILDRPWARRDHRDAQLKFFKLQRAREEILRVNVEARRLRVYVVMSEIHQRQVLTKLEETEPLLAFQLREQRRLRVAHNARHLKLLENLENSVSLSGFANPAQNIPHYRDMRTTLFNEVRPTSTVEGGLQRAMDDIDEQQEVDENADIDEAMMILSAADPQDR